MHRITTTFTPILPLAASVTLAATLSARPAAAQETATVQDDAVVQSSISLGRDEARLSVEMATGRSLSVALSGGQVYVDGRSVRSYEEGGALEDAWREFLSRASSEPDVADAWNEFVALSFEGADARAAERIGEALAGAMATESAGMPGTGTPGARTPTVQETAGAMAGEGAQEIVTGGAVLELARLEGSIATLRRLAPGVPLDVIEAIDAPLRVILEAGEYVLPVDAALDRSLMLVDTDGLLAGTVDGNVIVADGTLRLAPTAQVQGDLLVVGGTLTDQGATIAGALREIEEAAAPPVVAPPAQAETRPVTPGFVRHVIAGMGSLLQTLAAYLIFGFLGLLTVYFLRGHLENVADTVSVSFGRSFLAGLATQILFFPVLIVLVILVLTWPAIPFYVLGLGLAALMGYLAVAHAAGEQLTRHRFPSWAARLRRSNSYYYVLNGLAVLLALFAGAAIAEMGGPLLDWAQSLLVASAIVATWLAGTAGLGAVLLSRGGTRRNFARPREIPDVAPDTLAEELPSERASHVAGGTGRRRPGGGEVER